ncbi:MAG: Gfo/Idh/MocA family oxidoreductase [Clostridia bacterium]|nr:Gfo/Idh/MocA family oxidoreductase [Clostridia bacterium]
MEKIKIAVVGTGSICQSAHMPVYMKRDDVEIIACADIDYEKARAFAEKFGIPGVYHSVEELLANCKPDYVDVCTWPAAHAPVAIAAANAGCHVMCEKPICHNYEDAVALKAAVERNGVKFMLAVPLRYDKAAVHARELVDEGVLGDVYYGKTAYVRQRGIPGGWFSCTKYAGGGPIIDIGVHRIDLAWYMMGCPKPVSVMATAIYKIGDYREEPKIDPVTGEVSATNAWSGAQVPDYKFDVEDSASGVFRFENGAQLIFETAWSFNGPVNNSTQIAGDKAGITLEPFKLYKADGEKLIEEAIEGDFSGDIFANEIDHFIDCIRNDKTPSSNIDQAVQLQAMLMGIYESSKTGHEVQITY